MDTSFQPAARDDQRGAIEDHRQPPISNRKYWIKVVSSVHSDECRGSAFSRGANFRFPESAGSGHQWAPGLGGKIASANNWGVPAASQLPDSFAGKSDGCVVARSAGVGGESAARVCDGADCWTIAGNRRQIAGVAATGRMAEHSAKSSTGFAGGR